MLRRHVLLLGLAAVSGVSAARAADTRPTTIYVQNMHCADCARKIAGKLYAVPRVVEVRTSVQTHTAVVTPQSSGQPSPRALWEAVEKAGFKVVRLAGPQGTYNAKPLR